MSNRERVWTAEQVEAMAEQLNLVNLASTEHKASRMLRAYATTLRQQGESVDTAMTLEDRVEFALRDAGFDLDEASRIAALAQNAQCEARGHRAGTFATEEEGEAYSQGWDDAAKLHAERAKVPAGMVPDGRADALKLIAAASESYEVPAHLTPSKAEYVKAGVRSFIKHLNATLAAAPSQPEDAA